MNRKTVRRLTVMPAILVLVALLAIPAGAVQGSAPETIALSPTLGKAYLSIPAAAFQPALDGEDYENYGLYLHPVSPGPAGGGHYLAPVLLPHGATITAITFYWYDTSGAGGTAELKRTNRVDSNDLMASVSTFGAEGYGSSRDESIQYEVVDNVNYGYWLDWALLSGTPDVMGCGVTIEYLPPPWASKGYLSLPSAVFKPFEDGYDYENSGRWIAHFSGPGGSPTNGWYLAPVQLPQGATVTRMTFYFYDDSATKTILARLQSSDLAGSFYEMAYVDTAGYAENWGNRSTTAITQLVIDLAQRSYWVIWDGPPYGGPGSDASGVGVLIEYDNPLPVRTGSVSVPAPAFTPFSDDWQYQNHGRYLIHQAGGDTQWGGAYRAPVYLPQGAKVTRMTFSFNDDSSTSDGSASLRRSSQVGYFVIMVSIPTEFRVRKNITSATYGIIEPS